MSPPPATRRLLLVDDDEALGAPLAAFFRRHGIELQQATRPSDALALLRTGRQGRFDAALLDVMLPEMDGFELCRQLRREPPPLGTLPLVMLTARGE
jgi:two-component system, OmpR family, response regulator